MGTDRAFDQGLAPNLVLGQVATFVEALAGGDDRDALFDQLTDRGGNVTPDIGHPTESIGFDDDPVAVMFGQGPEQAGVKAGEELKQEDVGVDLGVQNTLLIGSRALGPDGETVGGHLGYRWDIDALEGIEGGRPDLDTPAAPHDLPVEGQVDVGLEVSSRRKGQLEVVGGVTQNHVHRYLAPGEDHRDVDVLEHEGHH